MTRNKTCGDDSNDDNSSTTRDRDNDEEEDEAPLTVDTPGPTAIEPPPEALAGMPISRPLETNLVAVQVIANDSACSPTDSGTCTVFAPATLGPGYTFTARVDDIDFLVTVPEGGVTEGEPFQVPYPQRISTSTSTAATSPTGTGGNLALEPGNSHTNGATRSAPTASPHALAPTGRWRNDLFDCCEVLCNAMFLQGFCCTVVLLGQVMTRLRLNACAVPAHGVKYERTICILLLLWIVLLFLLALTPTTFGYLLLPFLVYVAALVTNTRYFIRKLYNIPVQACQNDGLDGRCNDCCCGFWCICCVTIQMARHTHSLHQYPYQCCSPTGLGQNVPTIV